MRNKTEFIAIVLQVLIMLYIMYINLNFYETYCKFHLDVFKPGLPLHFHTCLLQDRILYMEYEILSSLLDAL